MPCTAPLHSRFFTSCLECCQTANRAGVLDGSLGDAVKPLKAKTGADYALFVWIRDT
jgi:hypothetical protein